MHTDYPKVRYWFKKDWINRKKENSAITSINVEPSSSSSHKGRGPQGINVTLRYVEDDQGNIIDGYRASEMRKFARSIWGQLAATGKAPKTWGKAELDVAAHYRHEMCHRFPELMLCEFDWKAEQLATDNYPNWASNNLLEVVKEELPDIQTKRRGDSVDRISKKARTTLPSGPGPGRITTSASIPSSCSSSAAVPAMISTTTTSVVSSAATVDTVLLNAKELGPKANTEGDSCLFDNPPPASSLPPIGPVTASAKIPSSSSVTVPATILTVSGIDPVTTVAPSSPLVNEVTMSTTNQLSDIPVATDMLTAVAQELQEPTVGEPLTSVIVNADASPSTDWIIKNGNGAANASSPEDDALISRNGMPCVRIASRHLIIYSRVIT